MRRTTVFADEDDLAVIKESAARQGIAEAEIIRGAIHLAALANREWDEPFFARTFAANASAPDIESARDDVWVEKAATYEQTKRR